MSTRWKRLLRHMRWADERSLASIPPAPNDGPWRRLMAHVLAAEQIWISRLEGKESGSLAVWPEWSVDECAALLAELHGRYERLLERAIDPEEGIVTYRNQSGAAFTSSVADVLTHVFMHGAYHRAQVARVLREAGHEPVNTDFITFAREDGTS